MMPFGEGFDIEDAKKSLEEAKKGEDKKEWEESIKKYIEDMVDIVFTKEDCEKILAEDC